jgi:predicted TIM-barrel fold metal-dependent hydrolase
MAVIDSCTHPTLNGMWLNQRKGITFSELSKKIAVNKIEFACAIGLPGVGDYDHQNFWEKGSKFTNLYLVGAVTSKNAKNLQKEIPLMANLGFKAIKFHPRLLQLTELEKYTRVLFNLAEEFNLKLFICGYVYSNISEYSDEIADFHKIILRNLKECPRLKIIYLHGGIHSLTEMLMWSRHNDNMIVDLSYSLQFKHKFDEAELEFILARLDLKVCYGSDHPDTDYESYLQGKKQLFKMDSKKSLNILGKNLINFLELN